MPRLSFVVTCYNFASYIGECLESILQQTATNDFEIVLIDDASTDASESVIRSFTDPRINFIRHPRNTGAQLTIQEGLLRARGEYIANISGDDRYRPYYLDRVLPILERNPNVGMVYGDVAKIDSEGRMIADPWLDIRSNEIHQGRDFVGDEYLALIREDFVPFSTIIFRREVLEGALPLPKGFLFVDWYLVLRIARRFDLAYVAATLADYRIHGANIHLSMRSRPAYATTLVRIFDQIFSEPDHQPQKEQIRKRSYASLYHHLAEIAFAAGELKTARQYYLRALRYQPKKVSAPGLLRHLGATWLGMERYNAYKARWRQRAPQ